MKSTQTPEGSHTFQEETSDYSLKATLTKDSLIITLKVYEQYSVYQAAYTEDHIGKQIHRKVDLEDIYYSLYLPSVAAHEGSISSIHKHGLDEVRKAENIPCFKIGPGGKLTVYKCYDDRYLKKNVTYESILSLNKISQLNQIQVITKRFQKEKEEMTRIFQNQIQSLKKQREEIIKSFLDLKRIMKEQTQGIISQLQTQIVSLKWRLAKQEQQKNQQQGKICQLEYKVNLLFGIIEKAGIIKNQEGKNIEIDDEDPEKKQITDISSYTQVISQRQGQNIKTAVFESSQHQKINLQAVKGARILVVQPNNEHKMFQELKKSKQVFVDDKFPPNENSIYGQFPKDDSLKGIKWVKISQTLKNPKIFHEGICSKDVSQGSLGDCYFLAAAAALAQNPQRIRRLFLFHEFNDQKYFSIRLLYKGKWVIVHVDQHIPWLNNKPAFAQAINSQLWVPLLQKAWAKLYSSYKRISAGYSEQPLHDLTGAPTKFIDFEDSQFNKEREWAYLFQQASKKKYAMVGSTKSGSDKDKSALKIVQGHAYTVLQFNQIHHNGTTERIVKCRNPWGESLESQYIGKWSDFDKTWDNVSSHEKERLGYTGNKTDGLFFMPYDIFLKEFKGIFVGQVEKNASYIYKTVKDPNCEGAYFQVYVFKPGVYSFQVDQTPERKFEQKKQQSFNYSKIIIKTGKLNEGKYVQLGQNDADVRHLCLKQKLTPGKHIIFARICYNKKFQTDFDLNLAVYAQNSCTIDLAKHQDAVAFSKKIGQKIPAKPKDKN